MCRSSQGHPFTHSSPFPHLLPSLAPSHLVLQGHDGVVLGGVDVQHVEVVLGAQVVGDVGEGGAGLNLTEGRGGGW